MQDLAKTIKELEKDRKRKKLLPHDSMTFRAMLLDLKGRKKELKTFLGTVRNAKMLLDMTEQVADLIEFLKSLLDKFL